MLVLANYNAVIPNRTVKYVTIRPGQECVVFEVRLDKLLLVSTTNPDLLFLGDVEEMWAKNKLPRSYYSRPLVRGNGTWAPDYGREGLVFGSVIPSSPMYGTQNNLLRRVKFQCTVRVGPHPLLTVPYESGKVTLKVEPTAPMPAPPSEETNSFFILGSGC
jgi:hypothetical protein